MLTIWVPCLKLFGAGATFISTSGRVKNGGAVELKTAPQLRERLPAVCRAATLIVQKKIYEGRLCT